MSVCRDCGNTKKDAMSVCRGCWVRKKPEYPRSVIQERIKVKYGSDGKIIDIIELGDKKSDKKKFLDHFKDKIDRAQMEWILSGHNSRIVLDVLSKMESDDKGPTETLPTKKKTKKNKNGPKTKKKNENGPKTKKNFCDVMALDGRYFLIYGKCQSGKTRCMQDLIFSHILFNKCSAIIILRNSSGDAAQLQRRCDEYLMECKKWMEDKGLESEGFHVIYANTKSKEQLLLEAIEGKNPSLIIAIANKTQMDRVANAIAKVDNPRYVVAIDEADQVAYGKVAYEKKKDDEKERVTFRQTLNDNILKDAGRVYGVTATSFDMLFSEDKIDTASVIVMKPQEIYHGLKKIELHGLKEKAVPANKTHDWFGNDGNIIEVLDHLGKQDCRKNREDHPFSSKYNPVHPTITIIKNTHLNSSQDKLLRHIAKHPDLKMWSLIIYNGPGITVYHPRSSMLQRMKGKTPCKRKWAGGHPVKNALFFKGVGISDGLEYLRQLDIILKAKGKSRVTHIAVISGDLADRGISFVSTGYHWHPTSMYYVPSKGASVSHVIQAAGRLCGNFNDSIPLQLFAPGEALEDLNKGINLQEDLIKQVKDQKGTYNVIESLQELSVSTAKIPYRNLGYQEENQELAIEGNVVDGEDNGASLDSYTENPILGMLEPNDEDEPTTPPMTSLGKLKLKIVNYVKLYKNPYRSAKKWLEITGLCGYKKQAGHHMALNSTLIKQKFLVKKKSTKGVWLYKLN